MRRRLRGRLHQCAVVAFPRGDASSITRSASGSGIGADGHEASSGPHTKTGQRIVDAAARIGAVVELLNPIAKRPICCNHPPEAARDGATAGLCCRASEAEGAGGTNLEATGEIGQQINGIKRGSRRGRRIHDQHTIERLSRSPDIADAWKSRGQHRNLRTCTGRPRHPEVSEQHTACSAAARRTAFAGALVGPVAVVG